jgi:hypothetical protein
MAARAGSIVADAAGSHAIYISKPEAVAALIATAAKSVSSEIAAGAATWQTVRAAEVRRQPYLKPGGASTHKET